MKNFKFCSLILLFLIFFINLFTIKIFAVEDAPALTTEGVVILNSDTGQVIYSKNPDTKYFPASTTKVLTALIILENCNLNDKVTIGKNPPYADGSSIGLKEGEIFSVKDLLLGLILESGNDCAEALAEHLSGTKEEFAKLMNKRALELGCTNSNFKNPSGLPDEEHYTTPKDLALIMREVSKNPTFIEICQTNTYQLPASNLDGAERWINNGNKILFSNYKTYHYKFSVAAKKGYTVAAKFTNVLTCTKNGITYVGAFLKGENINNVYSDCKTVFDYAFNNFKSEKIYSEGYDAGDFELGKDLSIPLLVGEDVSYILKTDDNKDISTEIKFTKPTGLEKTSFKRGDLLTTGTVYVNGEKFTEVPLVSGVDRNYVTPNDITSNFFFNEHKIFTTIILAIVFLIIIRIIIVHNRRAKRKRKRKRKLNQYNKRSKLY